jgi:predicted DNA-binding WGR domain protein
VRRRESKPRKSGRRSVTTFWEVDVDGPVLTIRQGKVGTAGEVTIKRHTTAEAAASEAQSKFEAKRAKGFVEVALATEPLDRLLERADVRSFAQFEDVHGDSTKLTLSAVAPRWGAVTPAELLRECLRAPVARSLEVIQINGVEGGYGMHLLPILTVLTQAELEPLRALVIQDDNELYPDGPIDPDDPEADLIDASPILRAAPNLQTLVANTDAILIDRTDPRLQAILRS